MSEDVYLHDLEVPFLADYAAKATTAIAEIGCAYGASTVLLLAHCPEGVGVHSIDPFVTDSMVPFRASEEECRRNVQRALKFIGRTEKMQQWKLVADYSYNAVVSWAQPLDLLFIDGDHRYEAVKKDFEDWFGHVKPRGYILFHDSRKTAESSPCTFDQGWPGPTRLADELARDESVSLVDSQYSITVFQKR